MNSTISIALTTFNSEKYLEEQLLSLSQQTLLPNELIIIDDASTDASFQIANEYSKKAPFPVIVRQNPSNIGLVKNFEHCIKQCSSDIILLSDADDFWLPKKIETYAGYFYHHQTCNVVFSNAEITDKNLSPVNQTYWDTCNFNKSDIQQFAKTPLHYLEKWCYSPGMTIGLKKSIINHIFPIPVHLADFNLFMNHDDYIPYATEYLFPGSVHLINQTLVKYRQHRNQLHGVRNTSLKHKAKMKIKNLLNSVKTTGHSKKSQEFHQNLNAYLNSVNV